MYTNFADRAERLLTPRKLMSLAVFLAAAAALAAYINLYMKADEVFVALKGPPPVVALQDAPVGGGDESIAVRAEADIAASIALRRPDGTRVTLVPLYGLSDTGARAATGTAAPELAQTPTTATETVMAFMVREGRPRSLSAVARRLSLGQGARGPVLDLVGTWISCDTLKAVAIEQLAATGVAVTGAVPCLGAVRAPATPTTAAVSGTASLLLMSAALSFIVASALWLQSAIRLTPIAALDDGSADEAVTTARFAPIPTQAALAREDRDVESPAAPTFLPQRLAARLLALVQNVGRARETLRNRR